MTTTPLTIQQGDYTVDLSQIKSIAWNCSNGYGSADVLFDSNVYDPEFNDSLEGAYTFEEEDFDALLKYWKKTYGKTEYQDLLLQLLNGGLDLNELPKRLRK